MTKRYGVEVDFDEVNRDLAELVNYPSQGYQPDYCRNVVAHALLMDYLIEQGFRISIDAIKEGCSVRLVRDDDNDGYAVYGEDFRSTIAVAAWRYLTEQKNKEAWNNAAATFTWRKGEDGQ